MTYADDRFGYDIIRNDLLRDLLGADHDSILYWAGKSLARKYPLETTEQFIDFFANADWGILTLLKEKKKQSIFQLEGEWIKKNDQRCYQLEAGFLAQQFELNSNVIAAATFEKKKQTILFTVQFEQRTT